MQHELNNTVWGHVTNLGRSRVPFLNLLFFLEECVPDRPRGWLGRGRIGLPGHLPIKSKSFFFCFLSVVPAWAKS